MARPLSALRTLLAAPVTIGLVAALSAAALGLSFDHLQNEAHRERERRLVIDRAALLRSRLEYAINAHLGALETTEALILSHRTIDEAVFRAVGPALQQGLPAIREVQLAPQGVIEYVYPPDRADAVRGLDLRALPDQREVVLQTIADGKVRIAGPLPLRQGGVGIVARNPVFIDERGVRQFWGFVTLVVDLGDFLSSVPGITNAPGLAVAIRGKDGLGERGEVFYGKPEDFAGDVVTAPVTLPQGAWQLAVWPVDGWARHRPASPWFRVVLAILAVAIGVLTHAVRARGIALYRMATIDPLTGALMRGAFIATAEAEIARALRHGRPLCALLLDVDHFKKVNDTHGHAAGDQVLAAVARCAAASLRPGDALGRIGGEEFAVVAPDTDPTQARALAERLRAAVEQLAIATGPTTLRVTVSGGIAALGPGRTELRQLLAAADAQLYEAKRSGRNRVLVAPA